MSTRPAPRRSSLAGSTPVTPPPAAAQPAPAATEPAPVVEAPAAVTPPQQATKPAEPAAAPARKTKYPPKVSFYQDPEDTARVRGTILHTMALEGGRFRNLSQFIDHAVMAEVERLEAKYNGGQPFPPMAPGELPQGRPMGE